MQNKRRILIIEDNSDIAELLTIRLELAGYATCKARDGASGIGAVYAYKPHAVLLDIGLPDYDGLTVLKVIKADSRIAHIPILMLTARQAMGDIQEALKLGAKDYVTKPFDDRKLLIRLARLLGESVPRPTVAETHKVWGEGA
jgi:DNA-binding response OmpR family regulator